MALMATTATLASVSQAHAIETNATNQRNMKAATAGVDTRTRCAKRTSTTRVMAALAARLLAVVVMVALLPTTAQAAGDKRMVVPIDNYFVYDGRSSDLAQHYYRRYLENDFVEQLTVSGQLPEKVRGNLSTYGLKFDDLPGLLQRALLWDAGYVLDLSNKPIRQYTRCGRSMAQIAVPLKGYVRGGCIPRNCSTLNGDLFYRSFFCDGHQMGAASLCASTTTENFGHSAMWADGAEPDDIPEPRVYRHPWTSDGESFLIYGIHVRGLEEEVVWEKCPVTPAPIFPCVPYSMETDTSKWCDPVPGKIVGPWMHNYALDHKKQRYDYVIAVGVAVAVLAIGLSRFFFVAHRRSRRNSGKEGDDDENRSSATSSSNGSNTGDYAHEPHDYLDTVADNEYTSWLYKSGIPESFHDDTEMLDGRDDAALKTLQLFEVHPLINFKRIALTNISLIKPLARGATGEVWLGTLINSGRQVAIKRLLPEKRRVLTEMQLFASEIFVMAKMKHPHVIGFIGVSWSTLQNMILVMQHMDKGDLQTYLSQQAPHQKLMQEHEQAAPGFTWWDQKLQVARGVASALQYLHSLSPKLIHRDIKSKNILLATASSVDNPKSMDLDVKVADFGISRRKYNFEEEETNLTMTGAVGTVSWTAPELLLGDDYSERIDIYSFGILLTEIDTCALPYHDAKSAKLGLVVHPLRLMKLVVHEGLRPVLSASCPPEMAELIADCLAKDPEQRPSAAEIVERLDVFEATHHC